MYLSHETAYCSTAFPGSILIGWIYILFTDYLQITPYRVALFYLIGINFEFQ